MKLAKLLLVLTLVMSTSAFAHDIDTRNILTVVGQGKAKIMAATADVQLGLEVQGKTAQEVQQALARQIDPVIEFLKREKVDRLQTGTINISPQYSRDTPSYVVGYTGFNTIGFSASLEQAGQLIDGAIKAGANRLQSLNQRPDDAALSQAQQAAIRAAVNDAKTQAKTVLESLELKERQIIKVTVSQLGGNMPVFSYAYRSTSIEAAPKATQLLPQEQEIQASVTVEVSFE